MHICFSVFPSPSNILSFTGSPSSSLTTQGMDHQMGLYRATQADNKDAYVWTAKSHVVKWKKKNPNPKTKQTPKYESKLYHKMQMNHAVPT